MTMSCPVITVSVTTSGVLHCQNSSSSPPYCPEGDDVGRMPVKEGGSTHSCWQIWCVAPSAQANDWLYLELWFVRHIRTYLPQFGTLLHGITSYSRTRSVLCMAWRTTCFCSTGVLELRPYNVLHNDHIRYHIRWWIPLLVTVGHLTQSCRKENHSTKETGISLTLPSSIACTLHRA